MAATDIWPDLKRLLTVLGSWGLKVQPQLAAIALTHSSYAHEHGTQANERLEFLGDAVLELIVSEYLYSVFPTEPEGELTRRRAVLVCEPTLARLADHLDLGEALRLGRGEEAQGGRYRPALLADAVEALLGAVYLSSGLDAARLFVNRLLVPYLSGEFQFVTDHKTTLQEQLQAHGNVSIEYRLLKSEGPAHARQFTVGLYVDGFLQTQGSGTSKKDAEQEAASKLLRKMSK
ncbi:MAG: ribonuclease III [bacterium]|jgi:ribonuclease-3|nr:ribonuclease III [Bacillota bacterium]